MFAVHTARPLKGPKRFMCSVAKTGYIHAHLPAHLGEREVIIVGLRHTWSQAQMLHDQVTAFQRDQTLPSPLDSPDVYLVVMEVLRQGERGKLTISQLRVIRPGDRFKLGKQGFYALSNSLPDPITAESAMAPFKDKFVRALLVNPGYQVNVDSLAPSLRPWARTLVSGAQ